MTATDDRFARAVEVICKGSGLPFPDADASNEAISEVLVKMLRELGLQWDQIARLMRCDESTARADARHPLPRRHANSIWVNRTVEGPGAAGARGRAYSRQRMSHNGLQMVDAALGPMSASLSEAAATLRDLLKAEFETVQLWAARSIIEMTARLRETVEFESRLLALESGQSGSGPDEDDHDEQDAPDGATDPAGGQC